jgi:hypothetical protein
MDKINKIYKHSHKSPSFRLGRSHHYFFYYMVVRITSKWQESPQFSKLSSYESCYLVDSSHMDSNLRSFQVVAFKKTISNFIPHVDAPPNSLMDSIVSPKGENNGRIRNWGTLFSL